ncbi:MAG: hypothetical protein II838_08205 [Lachnospiraceae bacterium]|nr:hypothetical protein [Lachnospiraceae bacterium]
MSITLVRANYNDLKNDIHETCEYLELFLRCEKEEYFGRAIVHEITGLKSTRASELIKILVDSKVIVPVTGHGKGK